ncbi:serine/threonine-protein kinase [Spirillospora sp. NPDC052242]
MQALGPSDPHEVGPYRTVALLGQGGMGRVFLCAGPDGRLVAVKRIHEELAENDGVRARFRREVESSRRVAGVRTVPVVDADADAPLPWLASAFVPAPSLAEALASVGPLPEESVRRLAAGLVQALTDVHGAGLVHRDLKPSNVLLAEDGPRVIDFGIARLLEDDGRTELTGTGMLIGSPVSMSPEQALGREMTAASDVFSLGATLVMASTGAAPFAGRSMPDLLYKLVHAEPDLGAVPPGLRALVEPCLAKDPEARPTPAELLERVGPVGPAVRPWPPGVQALIEDRRIRVAHFVDAAQASFRAAAPSPPVPHAAGVPAPPPPPTLPGPPAPPARHRRRGPLLAGLAVAAAAVLGATALLLPDAADGDGSEDGDGTPATAASAPAEPRSIKGPTPTPGDTPLSQVDDRYTAKPPTCKRAAAKVDAPDGFAAPSGYGPYEVDEVGTPHTETMCVWRNRSGDEINLMWRLFRTEGGSRTGAEEAKEFLEGFYWPDDTRRDFALRFAEEGLWKQPRNSGPGCILHARDVNLVLFVSIEGPAYPRGRCEPVVRTIAEGGLAATARDR